MEYSEDSGTQRAAAASPGSPYFAAVARRILAAHAAPDLRHLIVLLPNHHAAQPLALALVRAAGAPALLLPQMLTLQEWVESAVPGLPVIPESRRSALLYQQLRRRRWFDQPDLWGMTHELLSLFDELTHALDTLPHDEADFAEAVRRASDARDNATLQLEAHLVAALWQAMQEGQEIDEARARQQRLAVLAAQAGAPLYVLRTAAGNALEQRFLDAYAGRAPVEVCDMRELAANSFIAAHDTAAGLSARADELRAAAVAPLSGKLKFFAAASLEQEARAAAMQVRRWLAEGKRDIAVVVQDRVVARRMRALLERADVLVADEAGWTFATLSVATVLDRWLAALQSAFYHHDLLDLLKSPFIFANMTPGARKAAVYSLEQLLRKQGVVGGLESFIDLAQHEESLREPLGRLRQAADAMGIQARRTLAEWLDALAASLAVLEIDAGLAQDAAGAQLLQALAMWREELAEDSGHYRFAEWRRWLAQQLDTQTYLDTGMESTVRFTHLIGARWRAFDAVLLLGCDAGHLPSVADGGRWFNDGVRGSLGLPTRATQAARQRDDLYALLNLNDTVLVTWQREREGEEWLLSPFLELLRDLHALAFDDDLTETELPAYLAAEDAHVARLPESAQPAPVVDASMLPGTVTISAYNSLVACPYQFYARHILRLNELDEVPEGIEKRDYGEHVHTILQRFHETHAVVSARPAEEMETALEHISRQVFSELLARDFAARAWFERWRRAIPGYIAWQLQNEAEGWRYQSAESSFVRELPIAGEAGGVRLRGRIDRMDVKGEQQRVLDYKTQSVARLTSMLAEPGEDVQLACYAWAHGAEEAAFVSLDGRQPRSVAPAQDLGQLAELNAQRLSRVIAEARQGAGLPANGVGGACAYCEVRGLCRKGEWAA
ncbi:MAG TPA: PD-(D/E)XK nuclease family protein [Gallionellaceae bacterium]|nr:PD-(D/E)XK nuclease family protein [Gallionellaceae bacterium]